MKKRIVTLAVLATAITTRAFAGTFSDDFSAGLNPTYWSIYASVPDTYTVTATGGNVDLAKIATTSGNQVLNVVLNMVAVGGNISGNFSDQIDFSNAVIGPGDDQVQLDDVFADGSIFLDVYDLSAGRNVHVWNGSSVNNPISETATGGTFLISRTGSTVTGYFDGTTIYSQTDTAALSYIDFRLESQPNASTDSSSVTFDNFSVTAASVPEPSALVTAAAAGLLMMRRRRGKKWG
jgi:hypothetical protein